MIGAVVQKLRGKPESAASPVPAATSYAVILVASVLLALPLWIVKYPPLVDYPNHLARAFVLAHIDDPGYQFSRFYQADWGLYPYLLPDVLTVGMGRVVGIAIAGRLVLTLCIFLLPLATVFMIRQANPGQDYLALWALVVAYSPPFLMGFVSSQLSLPLCIFFVGCLVLYLKNPRWLSWATLLALATLLYFTHLLGFGAAGLITAAVLVSFRPRLSVAAASLSVFAPASLLYLYSRVKLGPQAGSHYAFDLHSKLSGLITPFRGYSKIVDAVTIVVFCVCVAATFLMGKKVRMNRAWLAPFLTMFVAFWAVPPEFGTSGYADIRIPVIVLLLALCVVQVGNGKRWLIIGALFLFAIRTLDVTVQFHRENARFTDMSKAMSSVPPGAAVMPILHRYSDEKYWLRTNVHFWAYGIVERGWVSPALFHIRGYQPLAIRQPLYCSDPSCSPLVSGTPDWAAIQQSYAYVWADNVPEYDTALERIGSRVYSSGPLSVFRLQKPAEIRVP